MPLKEQVIQTAREWSHNTRYSGEQRVLTGRRFESGVVSLDGAPPGKFWVRSSDYSREIRAVTGYVNQKNIPVIIAPDAVGDYYLARVDAATAMSQEQVVQYQSSVAVPPSSEVMNLSIGIEGFKPGRATLPIGGGMLLFIDSFWTDTGRVGARYVQVSSPTTPGTFAWARLGYDVANDAFIQYTSTATEEETPDVAEIPVVPMGIVPLDSVWLRAGQTTITSADVVVSSRQPYQRKMPIDNTGATGAPQITDDRALGYEVGSRWFNLSDMELYVCLNDTEGAATWALMAASDDPGSVGPGVISTARYGQALVAAPGTLKVGRNKMRIYNLLEGARTITKVFGRVDVAPTGASILIDIHKDGTTIFTNQAHRLAIAADANTGETTDIDVFEWGEGEYLDMEIDQIGTTAGSDLTLHIVYHS